MKMSSNLKLNSDFPRPKSCSRAEAQNGWPLHRSAGARMRPASFGLLTGAAYREGTSVASIRARHVTAPAPPARCARFRFPAGVRAGGSDCLPLRGRPVMLARRLSMIRAIRWCCAPRGVLWFRWDSVFRHVHTSNVCTADRSAARAVAPRGR